MKTPWAICAMTLLLLPSGVAAQATTTITGRVLPAWQMEAASVQGDANYFARVEPAGNSAIVLVIQKRGEIAAPSGQASVTLMLRSNAASFRLLAQGEGVQVEAGDASASGTAEQVNRNAVAEFRSAGASQLSARELTIAQGGRISMGGNFRSPNNALLVPIRVLLPESQLASAEPLRILFRISE